MKHASSIVLASLLSVAACKSPPPVAPTASPDIEKRIETQASSAAPGSARLGELHRGVAYNRNEASDFRVELERGKCYWIVGSGDDTVEKLGIYLWDQDDSRVDSDRSRNASALVKHCPEKTGTFKFEVKVMAGAGHFAAAIYEKAADDTPPPPPPKVVDLDAIIAAEAKANAPGATQVGELFAGSVGKNDWYTQLDKGTCYWFIGAGGDDIDDFYIYLWDPKNSRIGETKADDKKAVYGHCAEQSGMFHVQVKTDSGSEKYKLGIFAKKK